MRQSIFAFFLGVVLFSAGAAAAAAPPDSLDFPLVEGMVWRYDSTLGESVSTVSRLEDGYLLNSRAPHLVIEQVLIPGDWGIVLLRGRSEVYFVETERTYEPPMPRFPLPADVGMRWEWEGTEIVDGDEEIRSRIVGEVQSREKVRVPLGEFECLKVVITTSSSDGTESSSIQWVAPGIGPVKIRVEIEAGGLTGVMVWLLGYDVLEFELTSFEYPPTPPPGPDHS